MELSQVQILGLVLIILGTVVIYTSRKKYAEDCLKKKKIVNLINMKNELTDSEKRELKKYHRTIKDG